MGAKKKWCVSPLPEVGGADGTETRSVIERTMNGATIAGLPTLLKSCHSKKPG